MALLFVIAMYIISFIIEPIVREREHDYSH